MATSRISRIEEKRTKRQLWLSLAGIALLIVLIFTVGIPLLIQGSLFIGNLKSSQPVNESADKTPPYSPVLSSTVSATNSATLKVEGYGEPETTLKLMVNDQEVKKTLLGSDGSFSFNDITLDRGENLIRAISSDQSGNESAPSETLKVVYKKDAPKLEINQPLEGQNFAKNQQEITIKGSTDTGVNITINDRFVSAADNGSFSYNLKLNDGDNTLTIIARDQAGNETTLTRRVIYTPG